MISIKRFNRRFSNSFDRTGNKDIGLYDVAACCDLPGLEIMMTSATFHNSGTYFRRKDALIRLVSFTRDFIGSSFKIFPVIRSKPSAFFGLIFVLISRLISAGEVNGISALSS
jgi:hypothetical protein